MKAFVKHMMLLGFWHTVAGAGWVVALDMLHPGRITALPLWNFVLLSLAMILVAGANQSIGSRLGRQRERRETAKAAFLDYKRGFDEGVAHARKEMRL
jgi:hypothetical protein